MVLFKRQNRIFRTKLPFALLGILFIYIYCEYLIYYVVQFQCEWASLKKPHPLKYEPVYAMVIADTHLLGKRNGHWLDKWRREWQMHRAFQTAITIHKPEVVFVLGDLFDEGKHCPDDEFKDYVQRFHEIFKVPNDTDMYTVVGNHDIGFHYSKKLQREIEAAGHLKGDYFRRITPHLASRFELKMNSSPVQLVTIRGNNFVLINSMAMEGDGCSLCARAISKIEKIVDQYRCSTGSKLCKHMKTLDYVSAPILMQHYPLYRESDSMCTGPDAAPLPERNNKFEQRWDCISKEATEYLVENLSPRVAFGAHTHHSCVVRHSFAPTSDHKIEFTEYTVPSFSWRNRVDPKYYLLTVSTEEVQVSKCSMPEEVTIHLSAVIMLILLLIYLRYVHNSRRKWFMSWYRKKM